MQDQLQLDKLNIVAPIMAENPETRLQQLLPGKQSESRIQRARVMMGKEIDMLSDEDLDIYLTEFQHLINSWLDDFEKQTFSNKTLNQLLREV